MAPSVSAELATRAQAGDRDAFAQLYDQYSARIFDLCAHMLRDRDDAADATAEVFLAAAEHIAELRDPEKVTSWLYAIARNEVYRRTRHRARETAFDPVDLDRELEMDAGLTGDFADDLTAADVTAAAPAASAALLRDAALGLQERDRLVLELTLAGSLDGRALGDALGVSTDTAHQASHRMRERLARSVGALLVARQGRAECTGLQGVLASWDGNFSVLWRKRVARHVDKCALCSERRSSIPQNILTGTFAAIPVTWLLPPSWLRDRVLGDATLPARPGSHGDDGGQDGDGGSRGHGGRHWKRDGFPPLPDARRTRALTVVIAALGVVALLFGGLALSSSTDDSRAVVASKRATSTSTGSSAREAPSTTAGTPGLLDPGAASTSTTRRQTVVAPPAPPPTPAPDVTGPSLNVNVPAFITRYSECGPSGGTISASATDPSGVTQVSAQFSGAGTGGFPLGGGPTNWSAHWVPPNAPGTYTVTITAIDGRGNATSVSRSVDVDDQIC